MVMAGAGFFVLLFLYHLVDVWKIWEGAPFYFVGMNSILIYLLHEILEGQVPFCGDGCEGLGPVFKFENSIRKKKVLKT